MQSKFDIKRCAAAIVSCFSVGLVIFLSVFPAHAASYPLVDYNDFVFHTSFDGSDDHVYIKYPDSMCHIDLWTYYPSTLFIDSFEGNSATWEMLEGNRYYSNAYPMGYGIDAADSPKLDLSNIPDGTSIHFDITYHWSYYDGNTGLINTPTYDAWAIYYDDSGRVISSQQFTAGTAPGSGQAPNDNWSFDLVVNKPDGAAGLFFYAQLDSMVVYEEGELTFTLSNFTMDFSVSALYRLQMQTGKNSKLLTDVKDQLAAQGQTIQEFVEKQDQTNSLLGDIINGSDDQNNQAQDFKDQAADRNEQLDDAANQLGQLDKPEINIQDYVSPSLGGTAYQQLAEILSGFWEFDLLLDMMLILGATMLVSFLLFGVK